jgi:MFS family permease
VPLTKNTGSMRMSDALRRAENAALASGRAVRSSARAGSRATRRTGGFVHRITGAQGASRTGLATLIEMTAASGAADAFVTVALAGTIFFSTSVDQARGRVVLLLLITMAPFAVIAPFIGPALDRIQQGRRFVLAGTMMARGLLCYAMSADVANSVTLLPAAFGILVLQKAGGVVKASVTPRLLPANLTLVTVNARSGLISLAVSTVAAGLAAGIQYVAGAAWTLRVGVLIYLAAMILALRLPEQVDVPAPVPGSDPPPRRPRADGPVRTASARSSPETRLPGEPGSPRKTRLPGEARSPREARLPKQAPAPTRALPPGASAAPPSANGGSQAGTRPGAQAGAQGHHGRWRTLASVGPVVSEAMTVNAVLRAFSGYILFLLAFLLRSVNFGSPHHPVSHNLALGALAAGLSAGSLAAMLLGSFFRGRSPYQIMFSVLAIAPAVTIVCAWAFSLWAAAAVMFTAIFCASLAKLGQDSIVQREIGDEIRSSTFAVSETLNQVANVAGGLAGVLVSMLNNGQAGLAIAAAALTFALVTLIARRRQRVRVASGAIPPQPARTR